MSNFPFDEQSCWLAFGPWSHDSKDVRSVTSIHLHLYGLISVCNSDIHYVCYIDR